MNNPIGHEIGNNIAALDQVQSTASQPNADV